VLTTNCKTTVTVSLDVIHDVMINFVLRVIYTLAYTVLTAVFQMNLDSIFSICSEPLRILSHVTAPHQVLLGLLFIRFHHLTTGPTQHTPCSSCPYHLGLDYVDIQKVQTVTCGIVSCAVFLYSNKFSCTADINGKLAIMLIVKYLEHVISSK